MTEQEKNENRYLAMEDAFMTEIGFLQKNIENIVNNGIKTIEDAIMVQRCLFYVLSKIEQRKIQMFV